MNAPPWMNSITGRSCAPDGVHTLRNKQSSVLLGPDRLNVCGHSLPTSSASRAPVHGGIGCGARKRRSPTGGAANGTPRKWRTSPVLPPCNVPLSIVIVSSSPSLPHATSARTTAHVIRIAAKPTSFRGAPRQLTKGAATPRSTPPLDGGGDNCMFGTKNFSLALLGVAAGGEGGAPADGTTTGPVLQRASRS